MKQLLLFVICFSFITKINAQNSLWSWVQGDSCVNAYGIYGSKNISSPISKPGARNRNHSWTDLQGNLWMFGGGGNATKNSGYLNDLWKYNPSSNVWTWVSGDSLTNKKSVYGNTGTPSINNNPGARKNAVTLTDAAGNLWLFGGYGYGSGSAVGNLNDLWKFNTTTLQWTFVKGDTITNTSGLYGTKGTSSPNKKPGCRQLSMGWADNQGNLWIFGGMGYDETGKLGNLTDLWKFTPSTNKWTWVKGDSLCSKPGRYGSRGVASVINNPGARSAGVTWVDNNGNFYLMGGYGYDANNAGYLGDLWKYNPNSNIWTWVNGTSLINVRPFYGAKGVSSSSNSPGARDFSVAAKDPSGKLWLYGGYGYPSNGFGLLNDLWSYDTDLNEWTWINGDMNANGVAFYGIKGNNAIANLPGSRNQGVMWCDLSGALWIFGGQGYNTLQIGFLNDMWRFGGERTLPVQLITFAGKKYSEYNQVIWTVDNEINLSHYSLEKSSNGKDFITLGNIQATASKKYQFTDYLLSDKKVNYYRLKMVDKDGKFNYSKIIQLSSQNNNGISIYPNPAVNYFRLQSDVTLNGNSTIEIYNELGVMVQKSLLKNFDNPTISVSHLPPGSYAVRIVQNTETTNQKLIIIK